MRQFLLTQPIILHLQILIIKRIFREVCTDLSHKQYFCTAKCTNTDKDGFHPHDTKTQIHFLQVHLQSQYQYKNIYILDQPPIKQMNQIKPLWQFHSSWVSQHQIHFLHCQCPILLSCSLTWILRPLGIWKRWLCPRQEVVEPERWKSRLCGRNLKIFNKQTRSWKPCKPRAKQNM